MKILVIDDSALMRQTLRGILSRIVNSDVKTARDGEDALAKLHAWEPDVITLDINMPVMDGLTCLSRIMTEKPTPVVMLSSLTEDGALATLEAMELGAVDYVAKPGGTVCNGLADLQVQLREKVIMAAAAKPRGQSGRSSKPAAVNTFRDVNVQASLASKSRSMSAAKPKGQEPSANKPKPMLTEGLVVMGISTGGPGALECFLSHVPSDFHLPIVIAQHMPGTFTGVFAQRMDKHCALPVSELNKATFLEPGHVYIAKGERDCLISRRNGALMAMPAPMDDRYAWHPSASRLVASAMRHCHPTSITAIMMTGMGNDGAKEMISLASLGGQVVAQTPETSVVDSMPLSVINEGCVSFTGSPEELGAGLSDIVKSQTEGVANGTA
jgi:two-component system chemotaxis response regulator CheB